LLEINKIYNMDCIDGMKLLGDECVDLVVTSPPYDNLRRYKGFSFDFDKVAIELFRVVKQGGVVVWIVNDGVINGSETGTSFRQALRFMELGFNLYDTMIWEKPSPAVPTEGRYYDVFEYMFILSKGKPKTLNFITDRKNRSTGLVSKHEMRIGSEDRYTGGKRVVKEYSRRFNVWQISRGYNKTGHPAVFPEQLANDHIISWSNENDLVLDPFLGSGTTAKMALINNRNFIGFELSEEYVRIANERISGIL